MRIRSSVLTSLALAAALPACSGAPQTVPPPGQAYQRAASSDPFNVEVDGIRVHVMRPRNYPVFVVPHFVGDLTYHKGNVQTNPSVYVVFWQFTSDPDHVAGDLTAFLRAVGGSPWLHTVTQYYQAPYYAPKQFITNPAGQLKGVWYDNATPITAHPSSVSIEAEAYNAALHFGYDPNATYVVVTPHLHSNADFKKIFCAYHSATQSYPPVEYAYLPYMPDAGVVCGANNIHDRQGILEGVTINAGHELAETQTDPLGQGWYNLNYSHEIGDECAWKDIQYTRFGSRYFTTQPLWSDTAGGCVQ